MSGSPDLDDVLAGPVHEVAPRLLGAFVRRGPVAIRLTEVEAYAGTGEDPASHAHRGPTPRNAVMFGPPGFLYCYLSYGIHVCANVVTGPAGVASAVLLRAGEVVEGHDVVRGRRGSAAERDWARGPGRLGQALGLTVADDGTDLRHGATTLELSSYPLPVEAVASGPRVGVRLEADRTWRFWEAQNRAVSGFRRHPRAG